MARNKERAKPYKPRSAYDHRTGRPHPWARKVTSELLDLWADEGETPPSAPQAPSAAPQRELPAGVWRPRDRRL